MRGFILVVLSQKLGFLVMQITACCKTGRMGNGVMCT
jgi:hypothetical protein